METPKHFNPKSFRLYILRCAIQDRIAYLDAIKPKHGEPDEETKKYIDETITEIKCMKNRLKRLNG